MAWRDDPERRSAYLIEWRKNNPDRVAAYRAKTKEERKTKPAKTHIYKDPEQRKAYVKEWQTANKERVKALRRKWKKNNRQKLRAGVYGLSLEQHDKMLRDQEGVCAICHQESRRGMLEIDHCHSSELVRGLLCGSCNRGLGLFHDDPKLLVSAAEYLHRALAERLKDLLGE